MGGSETVVCQACGRPFTVYHEDATLDVSGVDSRTLLAPLEAAMPAGGIPWDDDEGGENTLAVEMEALNIPRASGVDLDEVGQATAISNAHQALTVSTSADDFDDSLARLALGEEKWRIRNDRGTIYELDSLEAAANWLEGRSNLTAYAIARGHGQFLPPESHPELLARIGGQSAGPPSVAPPLAEMPPQVVEVAPAPEPAAHPRRSSVDLLLQSKVETDGGTLGLGFILWSTIGGAAVTVVAMVLSVQMGWLSLPVAEQAPEIASSVAATPSKDDRVVRAVAAYDAEKFTAAAQLFEEIAADEDAPAEVHRYLAAALHKTGRQHEAKLSLRRYRALRDQKASTSKGE